jgi:phage FluMu protein Com
MVRNIVTMPVAGANLATPGCGEVRCGCGSLLARVVGAEVELKCRRCKHVWRIALGTAGDAELAPRPPPRGISEEAR